MQSLMSDYVSVPRQFKMQLNELFPIRSYARSMKLVPVAAIHRKWYCRKFACYMNTIDSNKNEYTFLKNMLITDD